MPCRPYPAGRALHTLLSMLCGICPSASAALIHFHLRRSLHSHRPKCPAAPCILTAPCIPMHPTRLTPLPADRRQRRSSALPPPPGRTLGVTAAPAAPYLLPLLATSSPLASPNAPPLLASLLPPATPKLPYSSLHRALTAVIVWSASTPSTAWRTCHCYPICPAAQCTLPVLFIPCAP